MQNYNNFFDYKIGRRKVTIPLTKEEFYQDIIGNLKKYISYAYSIHKSNVIDMENLHKQYLGLQDIITEKKRYDNSDINNKIVENHIFKQVNFKVGFMYGKPLDYSITNQDKIDVDDMLYLNKYFTDVSKDSLDIEKAQDLYEFGVSYQRLIYRRDKNINMNSEAPFELAHMPVYNTCVVYSDDIPSVPLFGLVVSKRRVSNDTINNNNKRETIYEIFLPFRKIEIAAKETRVILDILQPSEHIIIEEFSLNRDRIGIVEMVISLQNALNMQDSVQLDDLEQNVNSILAIFNQRLDDEFYDNYKKLRKERTVVLNTGDSQKPVDIKVLETNLQHNAANIYYERILKAMYDIVSVPQASGNVTSGGDTGQARLLGNGWESAQNQAQTDQMYLMQFERKLLKDVINICKNTYGCPVKNIEASDITIKFNINMSNNLLVKAEALKLMSDVNMPEKTILSISGITNDVDGVGDAWKKSKEEALKIEQSINTTTKEVNTTNETKVINE